jgi:hypothetical protein
VRLIVALPAVALALAGCGGQSKAQQEEDAAIHRACVHIRTYGTPAQCETALHRLADAAARNAITVIGRNVAAK